MEVPTSSQVSVDRHVTSCSAKTLSLSVRNVLFTAGSENCDTREPPCSRFRVSVLLGHAEVDDVDRVGAFGARSSDQKVVWLDVTVDEILLVNRLYPRQLGRISRAEVYWIERTICLAVMQHVLTLNLRPHMSNKSSSDGPRRSITRMLCSPSWPK